MKLLGNGITGRFFRVIHNLYHNIKSCVKFAGEQSSFFKATVVYATAKTYPPFYLLYSLMI